MEGREETRERVDWSEGERRSSRSVEEVAAILSSAQLLQEKEAEVKLR